MDLLTRSTKGDHLLEEDDELFAGVAPGSFAIILAVFTSRAAYRERVPCRKYSNPCRSALPGDRGNTGSSRSKAWIADFSSTQKTAACTGGFRYKWILVAAFFSKSGSLLAI